MGQKVYEAIAKVMEQMAHAGIGKDRKNQQQGYSFRGIDDVYNSLAPILARNRLCILPRVIDHHVVERETRNGGALFNTTVKMEFDLVSSEDGSKHTVATIGEAMDSADKSSNKAQSAAYKYMAFQTFCIPTEGDNDADAQTHEVVHRQAAKKADPVDPVEEETLLDDAAEAAGKGIDAYKAFWSSLTPAAKKVIGEQRHADFKILAEEAGRTTA